MSVDLTEPTTPLSQRLTKRKALRSELFTKGLFEETNLTQEHENANTHRVFQCLNCPYKKLS
jgi:hypothetical protein